eukprot:gnl/TRDRNA2_/TRDRNA2_171971_c0_seq1.p1 gnl/TRDRNA2_/TRDRNA2_171971_c0~~gnl/TRDRNA2_/TRDRNA2_171971_c0_seq1.p1  ORF type:complete len:194 (+),score=12.31 gnl/TRDRNA2_/TRDRNA2_171971_c0_seq1:2-583(+)
MVIPFPVCLAQINKLLLLVFVLICPLIMDSSKRDAFDPPPTKVLFPAMAAFIFFSVEWAGVQIECCFGMDAEDLNMLRFVRILESECIEMVRTAEKICKRKAAADYPSPRILHKFLFMSAPRDYEVFTRRSWGRAVTDAWFLCLKTEADACSGLMTSPAINGQSLVLPGLSRERLSPRSSAKGREGYGPLIPE